MKKYIFLSPNITNIGGAQIYLANKTDWLTNNGYKVIIISSKKGEIIIKSLEQYNNNIVKEITRAPHWFFRVKRERITNRITKLFDANNDEIIIESNTPSIAAWGELIAKQLNAKHIIFSLQETNSVNLNDLYSFLDFKLKRSELAGIKQEAFKKIFENDWEKTYVLKAQLNNIPKNISSDIEKEIKPADYTIGSIGRIDKPFIIPVLKDIIDFVQRNKDYSFNLLLIGGTNDYRQINKINKIVKNHENLKLYITGFIYPVPLNLILIPDLFISSAGACRISAKYNKLTISIDSQDYHPIGLLGITTHNTIYRNDNEPVIKLNMLLDDILLKKKYINSELKHEDSIYNSDYSNHIDFINHSCKETNYYEFNFNANNIRAKKIFLNVFGIKVYNDINFLRHHLLECIT